jgi:hypothetical protein
MCIANHKKQSLWQITDNRAEWNIIPQAVLSCLIMIKKRQLSVINTNSDLTRWRFVLSSSIMPKPV